MLDRTDHARLAEQTNRRLAAAVVADRYIPRETENPREVIGNNKAPGPIDQAKDALTELNGFLLENPAIIDHAQAKQAGGWIERTRISLKAMEDERSEKVTPLNATLKSINDAYRVVREPLEKVLLELRRRVTSYTAAEEAKRQAEAERLRLIAEEQALLTQQKIDTANEAIADADAGVCTDAGGMIADATMAIDQANRDERTAVRAEHQTKVRIGSVMGGRALAPRDYLTLSVVSVEDACKAIKVLGVTPELEAALCTAARKYEKATEEWPAGITVTTERRV